MADIKIDGEMLYNVGFAIGKVFAPLFFGIRDGADDGMAEAAAEEAQQIKEEEDAIRQQRDAECGLYLPQEKIDSGDCMRCWCDRCANIEECESMIEGAVPDGLRPFPCVDCLEGMRFMPEEEAPCDFFKPFPDNNG